MDTCDHGCIILKSLANDFCELTEVTFTIREQVGESGKSVGFDDLIAAYNGASGSGNMISILDYCLMAITYSLPRRQINRVMRASVKLSLSVSTTVLG